MVTMTTSMLSVAASQGAVTIMMNDSTYRRPAVFVARGDEAFRVVRRDDEDSNVVVEPHDRALHGQFDAERLARLVDNLGARLTGYSLEPLKDVVDAAAVLLALGDDPVDVVASLSARESC